MQTDIRTTARYLEAEALYRGLRQPGTGQISDAAEVHASPDGRYAVFAGTLVEELEGIPPSRICSTDLASGETRILTAGPGTDRSPKVSPRGDLIAFLSDREAGDFQLYLLDLARGGLREAPRVSGWIEYLHWSPDGQRILLGVAGHGADIFGGQGALKSRSGGEGDSPDWMPSVETGKESFRWRSAWVYAVAGDGVRQVSPAGNNIWEAVWCGNDALAAVISPGPEEGLWYSARLVLIDIASGHSRELYAPRDQLGWPAADPSGRYVAIVEALCSDRWIVAGDVRLIDRHSGNLRCLDTQEWTSVAVSGNPTGHCFWQVTVALSPWQVYSTPSPTAWR